MMQPAGGQLVQDRRIRITPMKNISVALVLSGLVLTGCATDQGEEQRAPRAVSYVTLAISEPGAGGRLANPSPGNRDVYLSE